MATWQLQTAKNKFSELVDASQQDGPQIVTRRGNNVVVVMSYEQYQQSQEPQLSAKEVLMSVDFSGLDLTRDKSTDGRGTPQQLPW
jgi:prevent-host-death family protein